MADDLERQAAQLVEALLESVGLHASYGPGGAARAPISADEAFARVPPIDRASHARLMARALRHFDGTEAELRRRLIDFLSRQYGAPAVDLSELEPDPDALALLPGDVARAHAVLPLAIADDVLLVAMPDPSLGETLDALSRCTGLAVEPVIALLPDLDEALERYYPR